MTRVPAILPAIIPRTLFWTLDRPGGRHMLAWLARRYVREKTGQDVHLFYDDAWIHRMEPHDFIVESPQLRFRSLKDNGIDWPLQHETFLNEVQDYWYHAYKPTLGDIIVDVGAGVGTDALIFSRSVGQQGRVIAIEAHPKTFRCLQKLCQWNQLANISCLQYAITDRRYEVSIQDSGNHQSNSIIVSAGDKLAAASVSGITLDEVCDNYGIAKINFLKMNIEGAERTAINGMKSTIQRTEFICIACDDFMAERRGNGEFRTRELVIEFLRSNDFNVMTRDDDDRPYVRDHIHGMNKLLVDDSN